jgi:hypothetical protein
VTLSPLKLRGTSSLDNSFSLKEKVKSDELGTNTSLQRTQQPSFFINVCVVTVIVLQEYLKIQQFYVKYKIMYTIYTIYLRCIIRLGGRGVLNPIKTIAKKSGPLRGSCKEESNFLHTYV